MGQTRAALGRLEQFMRAAGPKGALTMELAARDFSYTLARIYTGGGKGSDGFQSGKGLGSRPGMAGIQICPVKGGVEGSWVPPFFQTEAAQPGHAADVTPCCSRGSREYRCFLPQELF